MDYEYSHCNYATIVFINLKLQKYNFNKKYNIGLFFLYLVYLKAFLACAWLNLNN